MANFGAALRYIGPLAAGIGRSWQEQNRYNDQQDRLDRQEQLQREQLDWQKKLQTDEFGLQQKRFGLEAEQSQQQRRAAEQQAMFNRMNMMIKMQELIDAPEKRRIMLAGLKHEEERQKADTALKKFELDEKRTKYGAGLVLDSLYEPAKEVFGLPKDSEIVYDDQADMFRLIAPDKRTVLKELSRPQVMRMAGREPEMSLKDKQKTISEAMKFAQEMSEDMYGVVDPQRFREALQLNLGSLARTDPFFADFLNRASPPPDEAAPTQMETKAESEPPGVLSRIYDYAMGGAGDEQPTGAFPKAFGWLSQDRYSRPAGRAQNPNYPDKAKGYTDVKVDDNMSVRVPGTFSPEELPALESLATKIFAQMAKEQGLTKEDILAFQQDPEGYNRRTGNAAMLSEMIAEAYREAARRMSGNVQRQDGWPRNQASGGVLVPGGTRGAVQ